MKFGQQKVPKPLEGKQRFNNEDFVYIGQLLQIENIC